MAWDQVAKTVRALPAHHPVRVEKADVPHPLLEGFYQSRGLDRQATAHYRRRIDATAAGLHVLDYDDHYLIHWDRIDPSVSVIGHFFEDVVTAAADGIKRTSPRIPVQVTL